jgi:hypothetical protein
MTDLSTILGRYSIVCFSKLIGQELPFRDRPILNPSQSPLLGVKAHTDSAQALIDTLPHGHNSQWTI